MTDSMEATAKSMQNQQTQLMNSMNQMITNADLSCGPGTDCYKNQQIMDAKSAYDAAIIAEQSAPKKVDVAYKNYLVASQGESRANQVLLSRYTQNGADEKAKQVQQMDAWSADMTEKINTNSGYEQTIQTLGTNINTTKTTLNQKIAAINNATDVLNLLERKIHYTNQQVEVINSVEHYVKLVCWLAFMTWGLCVVYTRAFTLKTAGLFVLFTTIILMQTWIMDGIIYFLKFFIPTNTYLTW